MKSKIILPQFGILATFAALSVSAHAAVVYLPTSATPTTSTTSNQSFANTITGAGFSDSKTITSGETTLEDALTYTALIRNNTGNSGPLNGRFSSVTSASVVDYSFSTPLNLDGLLLWNYNEYSGTLTYNERGITRADITITYDGGQTFTLQDVAFTKVTDSNLLAQTAEAQKAAFGAQYADVTNIRFSDLQGGNGGLLGWQEFAVYAVPEPSAALLGGLGMLTLLRRRRA